MNYIPPLWCRIIVTIFFGWFDIYYYYFPVHPPTVPHPIPPPCPLSPWGCPHLTSKFREASSLLRVRCIISEWTQTQQSSSVCVLGASYQLVHAACLVVQWLIDLGGGVQINWDCWFSYRIALLLSFFQPWLIQQQGSVSCFCPLVGYRYLHLVL